MTFKKITKRFVSGLVAITLALSILPINVFAADSEPSVGTTAIPEIKWKRSSENGSAVKQVNIQGWNWSTVTSIPIDSTGTSNPDRIWDGQSTNPYYTTYLNNQGMNRAESPSATWKNYRTDNGTTKAEIRRFKGEFAIPAGYNANDAATVQSSSLDRYKNFTSLNNGSILPINDNIYIFVYKKGETSINNENFGNYLAMWTGSNKTGSKNLFKDKAGTEAFLYRTIGDDSNIKKALAHTDTWYANATLDNLGATIKLNYPDATAGDEFVIDVITEDTSSGSSGGGMDKLQVMFTKTNSIDTDVTVEYRTRDENGNAIEIDGVEPLNGQYKSGTPLDYASKLADGTSVLKDIVGYTYANEMDPKEGLSVSSGPNAQNVLTLFYKKDAAKQIDYTVEYYKDSVTNVEDVDTFLGKTETISVAEGTDVAATVELNKHKPEGYKDGVVKGNSVINSNNIVIKVLYEKGDNNENGVIKVKHEYYDATGTNLESSEAGADKNGENITDVSTLQKSKAGYNYVAATIAKTPKDTTGSNDKAAKEKEIETANTELLELEKTLATAIATTGKGEILAKYKELKASLKALEAELKALEKQPSEEVTKPVDGKPVDGNPAVENPAVENPVVEKPADGNPVDGKPAVEKTAVGTPVIENPADENPVVENPVVENPVVENPVVEKPADGNPVVEKPVIENPADAIKAEIEKINAEIAEMKKDESVASMINASDAVDNLNEKIATLKEELAQLDDTITGSNPELIYDQNYNYSVTLKYSRSVNPPIPPTPPIYYPVYYPTYTETTILDEETPLGNLPDDIVEIVDEEVPLGKLPKSGGLQNLAVGIGGASLLSLAFVLILKLKKKENQE